MNENISLFDRIHADPGLIHNMYGLMLHARWSSYSASLFDDVSRWDRVWIARNPYVRFLSSYLDWDSRNAALLKARNTSVGFERFTSMYERSLTEGGVPFSGWVYLPSHVRPVTQVCKADQFGVDVVLRLEQVRARPLSTSTRPLHPTHSLSLLNAYRPVMQMDLWYDTVMHHYGLDRFQARLWAEHGFDFYVPGVSKSTGLADKLAAVLGEDSWSGTATSTGGRENDAHERDSAGKIAQYYTPAIARKVFELQRSDFEAFGYPVWDGNDARSFRAI